MKISDVKGNRDGIYVETHSCVSLQRSRIDKICQNIFSTIQKQETIYKTPSSLRLRVSLVVFLLVPISITLSSCETLKGIQDNEGLKKIGSFQLNPVQDNTYWYSGRSYEYNEYQIEITTEPVPAKIQWNGKTIGTTPCVYRFSGTLDIDDRVVVRAIPVDKELPGQEAVLRIRTELPRKIHFKLTK